MADWVLAVPPEWCGVVPEEVSEVFPSEILRGKQPVLINRAEVPLWQPVKVDFREPPLSSMYLHYMWGLSVVNPSSMLGRPV